MDRLTRRRRRRWSSWPTPRACTTLLYHIVTLGRSHEVSFLQFLLLNNASAVVLVVDVVPHCRVVLELAQTNLTVVLFLDQIHAILVLGGVDMVEERLL